jgi:hypothetical protein
MTSNNEAIIAICKNDGPHVKVEFKNGELENKEEVTI